jgi:uncharacterized lipoprotein
MIKKILFVCALIFLSSCSSDNKVTKNPLTNEKPNPGLFSKDASKGISLSDLINPKLNPSNINVNAYLWRASLNVLSIAPLISTDALGGTIITDWYVNQNIRDKRIKISAYISTSELRSNGINVKVHVQKLKDNVWSETFIDKKLATKIENSILNEARNLRINSDK